VPERFEFSTRNAELLAGVTAAVDHLAGLDPSGSSRRERIVSSLRSAQRHESELLERLVTGLAKKQRVTVLPAGEHRCPTVSFLVEGEEPAETARLLGERKICVMAGNYYAHEYFQALGKPGAVRASIYHYNTEEEVDRLLDAL
jgi:selenocysteine lyase/cysteine desulfurase